MRLRRIRQGFKRSEVWATTEGLKEIRQLEKRLKDEHLKKGEE